MFILQVAFRKLEQESVLLEQVLRLLRVDANLKECRVEIFKGQRVSLIFGALFRLRDGRTHLTVLQSIIGNVGDELLTGDGHQSQHSRVVSCKAGTVHVVSRHRVGNGGLVVVQELQKVNQRLT